MKIAIYPGSFNPWHKGHQDVLDKALMVFDKVVVARGVNPEKQKEINEPILFNGVNLEYVEFSGLLSEYIKDKQFVSIIKGIRNNTDFEYEKTQQYWNEDLGISIPTFYIISDRNLVHISSSAIKNVKKYIKL